MPPVSGREPLRIGYVGERFRDLSGMRHFLGWMRGHNRDRFAVYAWYTGATMDKVTEEIRSMSAGFHHFPRTQPQAFEETCRSIRSLNLHALIFLDAGMESDITQIAALRLAPLQCKAWDQPITSGLPTIDYAFTPELSEPEGGERHYSEQLMRLPGVGVCYQKPIIPTPLLRKTRRDFGLREDACVYLCSQQAFKFLPQNDAVFAQIASRVPDAQFVFTIMNAPVRSDFLRRLSRAFEAVGLRAEDHCVVLPELRHLDYWNLQLLGDVFLDTIGWSSGGSVFEAIACNVPVVTVAGEFMRGRQGAGILLQLGLGDTVARDIAEYVELAARLGQNRPFREEIVRRVAAGHPGLFSDARSVGALDDFFEREIFPRAGR
ncbi:MAG TPA: hypothetical protein VG273_12640 [Bryobacteraceae bacterium]|nr:hypothetical protein [Bryobacteraceae bacterium]